MPALSFKKQFVPLIRSGKKPFTLRAFRKDGRDTKGGDVLYFYTAMRTKACRKIRPNNFCLWAKNIALLYGWIGIEGWPAIILSPHLDKFAQLDGFADYTAFCEFHQIKDGMAKRGMRMIAWDVERKIQRQIFEKRFLDVVTA